ncbi:MAG: hypothetical protein GY854_21525, partial [Deltaproteobacteria bacterium]|nr:hypothetical protein [Deltaproteobacteria bacterium]
MKVPILFSTSFFMVMITMTPSIVRAEDEGFLENLPNDDMDEGEKWVEDSFEDPTVSADPVKEVDIEYFFDKLSPYGQWLQTEKYGLVWQPSGLADDWQPYTFGHWVYTDYGWTWVSSFPWGWAAFHYGSWAHLDSSGWVWVPSGIWSPARVVWRYS